MGVPQSSSKSSDHDLRNLHGLVDHPFGVGEIYVGNMVIYVATPQIKAS